MLKINIFRFEAPATELQQYLRLSTEEEKTVPAAPRCGVRKCGVVSIPKNKYKPGAPPQDT
jgi:hypothetical protein